MINSDRIGDELEVELIEISLNINTLHVLVIPIVDQHEVIVDFPASILTHHNANIVAFVRFNIDA